MKNYKSFTVLELLIVVAVIGLISSVILVSLSGTRDKARVAKGLEFSHSVQNSLGAYAAGVWDLDEGLGNPKDSSGNGNDGTITGATWTSDTPSAEGYALSFDGNGDYVDCGSDSTLDITDAITLEAWFKWGGANEFPRIIAKQFDGVSTPQSCFQLGIRRDNNKVRFSVGEVFDIRDQGSAVNDNAWHHLVGTYDMTDTKIYLDGQEIYSSTLYTDPIRSNPDESVSIGITLYGLLSNYEFDGVIEEVRIYTEALSSAQIQENYLVKLKEHQGIAKK